MGVREILRNLDVMRIEPAVIQAAERLVGRFFATEDRQAPHAIIAAHFPFGRISEYRESRVVDIGEGLDVDAYTLR